MYFSITVAVWVIITTILTVTLIRRSKWKLYNPDWAEIAANKHVEEKRLKRDRRKKFDMEIHPDRRKTYRSKV
jgi:hypothetical protein